MDGTQHEACDSKLVCRFHFAAAFYVKVDAFDAVAERS